MIEVLLLGGTGVIGTYLSDILNARHITTTITSREKRENAQYRKYIVGNAHDEEFLQAVLNKHWDAVVDFMSYKTIEFKNRVRLLLNSTDQYIYISSSRVYADIEHPIKETSPRLLDVCQDERYLATDEYALTKARQEDILRDSKKNNYTIIRPYITYGDYRLQLGVMEKEEWLYRAMHGRTIVFSKEIASKITTLTNGYDVAFAIYKLIGNQSAYGETFHITSKKLLKWEDVVNIYFNILSSFGIEPKIKYVDTQTFLNCRRPDLKYQVLYDRLYNRDFNTEKESNMANADSFIDPEYGLNICLQTFLKRARFLSIDWEQEAYKDKIVGEWTHYSEIRNPKLYIKYLLTRFGLKKR